MKQFIRQMLSEESGKPSIKRMVILILTIIFSFGYLCNIFSTASIEDIPNNWLVLFLGILGIMVAGRTIEKTKQ